MYLAPRSWYWTLQIIRSYQVALVWPYPPPYSFSIHLLSCANSGNQDSDLHFEMLSFKNWCINGIIQYVTFGDWRFLPKVHVSMICSSYCWVVLHIMNVLQWNYSSIDGHLGFFQFGAVMNKAAMTYAWKYISVSLGEMSELKISGFYDSCLFCFIRICEIFPEGLVYHFTFPPAVYEWCVFSGFLPVFRVIIIFILTILIGR